MVSLLELAKVALARDSAAARDVMLFVQVEEEGVTFRSPTDGSMMLLTPEKRWHVMRLTMLSQLLTRAPSIEMQNEIGADVIMALDDVISSQTTGERVEEVPAPPSLLSTEYRHVT